MAFDGLFTTAMRRELQAIENGRITKIHQPNAQEIVLVIRAEGQNRKLLFSVHPSYARVQFTEETIQNPSEPPMFCMTMRKHLEGGTVTAVRQTGTDRILTFRIRSKNEIGDDMEREIIFETMGRHSNFVLIDPERNMIVDSLKHLPPAVNSYRTIMPGQPYVPAPAQDKLDPFELTEQEFDTLLPEFDSPKAVVGRLSGFSPVHAEELLYRMHNADSPRAFDVYNEFVRTFSDGPFRPNAVEKDGKLLFSAADLTFTGQPPTLYPTLGELLDKVYFARAVRERVKAQAADLERWLDNEIAKLKLKVQKLEKERKDAGRLDTFQLYGELLTANSYAIGKGQKEAEVDNYYEQGTTVTIPLDPRKTVIENAQRYFSKYAKAKNALIQIADQLEKAAEDISYFEMVKQQVMQASTDDIDEIRDELADLGLMKARKGKKKAKPKKPMPESYVSTSGTKISVGKNNRQNDWLTSKLAARNHIWLHTKDIPGSHVVIHDEQPDDGTIQEAAALAAYFSKARGSASVPVDFTEVRHVKKPNGSKPGFVIYFEQQTVYVTPDEDLVRKLKA
ncbi:Rqc2 family fibronectin-binding protein [Sporosarcina koreensis]|uniref:Rqc2 family fibronectin-binding protein n=1 Tax=Sporosarcina koreensis TaxID=334735 RepID=UPI00058FF3AC|nr:NFACT RNA binding domain-containing protein [Sporosarcina koreensis]